MTNINEDKVVDVNSYINDLKNSLNVYDELLSRMDKFSNIFKSLSENMIGFNELINKICSNTHENELNGLENVTKCLSRFSIHGDYFIQNLSNMEEFFKKGSDQNFSNKLTGLKKSLHKLKKDYYDKNHQAKCEYKKALKRIKGLKKKTTPDNELNYLDHSHKINEMETKKTFLKEISKSTLRQAIKCERENLFSFIDYFSGFNSHLMSMGETIKCFNETWAKVLRERQDCANTYEIDSDKRYSNNELPVYLIKNIESYKTEFSVDSSSGNLSVLTSESDNYRRSSLVQQSLYDDKYDENEDSAFSNELDRTILPDNPNNILQNITDNSLSSTTSKLTELPPPPDLEPLYPNQLFPPPSYQNIPNLREAAKKRYGSLYSYVKDCENSDVHYDYSNVYYQNINNDNKENHDSQYSSLVRNSHFTDSASVRILKTKPFDDTAKEDDDQVDNEDLVIPPSIELLSRNFSEPIVSECSKTSIGHSSTSGQLLDQTKTFGYGSIRTIKHEKPLARSNSMVDTNDTMSNYESFNYNADTLKKLSRRPKLSQKRPVLNDPNSYRHSYVDDIANYYEDTFY